MGADLGTDVATVEGLYRELNGILGSGRIAQVLASRERVQSVLGTAADVLFNLVKNRVAEARELRIDIEEMRELLKRSKMALSVESFHEGLAFLKECSDRARKATAMHRQTQKALASAAALAAEARKRDVDVSKVLEILLEGKRAFERLDYGRATELAAKARVETERLTVLYSSAQKILSTRERMELAARLGLDVPHLQESLTKAKEAMKSKDYPTALEAAQRVEEEITKLMVERLSAMLGDAKGLVGSVPGVNLATANEDIVKAQQFIEEGRLGPAAEAALRIHEQVTKVKEKGDACQAAIAKIRDLVADIEGLNVEIPNTARLLDQAERASKMGAYDQALEHAMKAEAEAIKERDQGIAAAIERYHMSLERAKREGTDTRSAEKLLNRARDFLRGKKYSQALALAGQSEGEVDRVSLQQDMASQALATAERKLQNLGAPAKAAEGLAREARKALKAADYVKTIDLAIKASDAVADVRGELDDLQKVREKGQALLRTAVEIGAEAGELEAVLEEGNSAVKGGDLEGARAFYDQSLELGADLLRNHMKELLAKVKASVDTCKRVGGDATSALARLAQARASVETGDFAEALTHIHEGRKLAESAMGAKLHEALADAADNVSHAKKLGSDAKQAEEMLREAKERMAQQEFESALHLTERALEHVESSKVVEKRFVDLTYKAESTIRNGKKFGVDMRPAEKKLAASMSKRSSNMPEAIRIAEESYRLALEAVEAFAPKLEGALEAGPARLNEWMDATLTIKNTGKGLAKDVRVKILGDAETEGVEDIAAIRAKGEETLKLRLKMTAPGSVPLAIQVTSHRVFDDKAYTQEMIAQVEVAEGVAKRPEKLVADLATRCPICKGMIKKGFKVLRCSCGRDFHELCATRVGRCPVCFQSVGGDKA